MLAAPSIGIEFMSENLEATQDQQAWGVEGYSLWPNPSPFVKGLGPLFVRPQGEHLAFRIRIRPEHANSGGHAHGGFISTLADIWLGYNVNHLLPKAARFVTSNLSISFLRIGALGQILDSQIDRIKIGSKLHHASGVILCDGKDVAAMSATFAALPDQR